MPKEAIEKRVRLTAVQVVICALCACEKSDPPEAKAIERAKELVSQSLIDPQSVQYRNVKALSEGVVCGEVNAKNRLGGYAGFRPFVYNGEHLSGLTIDDREEVKFYCHDGANKRKAHLEDLLRFYSENCNRSGDQRIWCESASATRERLLKQ